MAGITGLGTTYDLPNYTGVLHGLSPAATPFFSAIGGLNGGGQTTSTEFEWSTYDLRNPGQNTKTEGATAPTAEARVRANVTNVTQIHQEKVSVSYSKQSARGQKAGSNNDKPSNVQSERDWQIEQMLKQMVLDVEWSFLNGTYAKPGTNATARKTRGLIQAIATNKIQRGAAIAGATSATDTITSTAHGLAANTAIVFANTGGATGVVAGRVYYVAGQTANTFKVTAKVGGSNITLGTATGIDIRVPSTASHTRATISTRSRVVAFFAHAVIVWPSTSSIAIKGIRRAASAKPASYNLAIPGCCTAARISASCVKRLISEGPTSSGRTTLSATILLGKCCSAR